MLTVSHRSLLSSDRSLDLWPRLCGLRRHSPDRRLLWIESPSFTRAVVKAHCGRLLALSPSIASSTVYPCTTGAMFGPRSSSGNWDFIRHQGPHQTVPLVMALNFTTSHILQCGESVVVVKLLNLRCQWTYPFWGNLSSKSVVFTNVCLSLERKRFDQCSPTSEHSTYTSIRPIQMHKKGFWKLTPC